VRTNWTKKLSACKATQRISRGLLAGIAMLAVCGFASAQERRDKQDTQARKEEFNFNLFSPPVTPTPITPPVGNRLFLAGRAFGSQGYV